MVQYSEFTQRVVGRSGYAWAIHMDALKLCDAGHEVIMLTVGTGRPCTADNVVVVPGAQGGLFCALQCLAGPGDEVVVPEPVYATYERVVGAAGARAW